MAQDFAIPVKDHGALTGLADDDHPQYFTRSGVADADSAWADWTPTLTNITLGSGIQVARYVQVGKTVHLYYSLDFGTSTTIDTNQPVISLPVAAALPANDSVFNAMGTCALVDTAGDIYVGVIRFNNTTTMRILVAGTSGTYATQAAVSATVPFTWGTDDRIVINLTYEAA